VRTCEYDFKKNHRGVGCDDVDWINLPYDVPVARSCEYSKEYLGSIKSKIPPLPERMLHPQEIASMMKF
jgi:hypothetical protein